MIKFWVVAIGIFVITPYLMHKAVKKYLNKGEKMNKKSLFSIYHWELMIALGSGITYLFLLILKSTNLLTF